MPDKPLPQSPLATLALGARAARPAGEAGVELAERPSRGQLAIRGEVASRRFKSAIKEVLGVELPVVANSAATYRGVTMLWLGPDEWLATMPDGRQVRMAVALEEALADEHVAITDVSHGRGIIGVAGPNAREVLMKGCSLDFHPRSFEAGRCAQSRLARCDALIHQLNDAPSYDLYVHRSFMGYVWAWLEDAAHEYGVAVVAQS